MDDARQHENGRHKPDYYRGSHSPVLILIIKQQVPFSVDIFFILACDHQI